MNTIEMAANKRLAEALGWAEIVDVGGALLGRPPGGAPESRDQVPVPDWTGDWAAAGPLLAQYEIRLTPMSTAVDASGFFQPYSLHGGDRDVAARAAVVMAATSRIEHGQAVTP